MELIERLPNNLTAAEATFFVEKLSKDYQNPYYRRLVEYFAPRVPVPPCRREDEVRGAAHAPVGQGH